ncbi:MAG: glycosyltransferase family 2 protein [Desulfurella sp.]
MYVEDLDYSYKVWKVGYKLYHVTGAMLYHKVGASNEEEVSEFSAYWGMRSRVKFMKKLPFIYRLTSFLFLIISRFIRFPVYLLEKRQYVIKAQIKGFLDG